MAVPAGGVCGVPAARAELQLFFFLPDLIKEVLSMDDEIQKLATELYHQKSVLIMGRGYHYATCLEGALVSASLGEAGSDALSYSFRFRHRKQHVAVLEVAGGSGTLAMTHRNAAET